MTLKELLEKVSHDLMFTLYGHEGGELKHRGLFAPTDERSLEDMLSRFGDVPVSKHETYKSYVMVYLDEENG